MSTKHGNVRVLKKWSSLWWFRCQTKENLQQKKLIATEHALFCRVFLKNLLFTPLPRNFLSNSKNQKCIYCWCFGFETYVKKKGRSRLRLKKNTVHGSSVLWYLKGKNHHKWFEYGWRITKSRSFWLLQKSSVAVEIENAWWWVWLF